MNKDIIPELELEEHADTRFQRWWYSITERRRHRFACDVDITINSLRSNYFRVLSIKKYDPYRPTNCRPSIEKMQRLADATGGMCSAKQLREHFYPV